MSSQKNKDLEHPDIVREFAILFFFLHPGSQRRADMTVCHQFYMSILLLMCAYASHAHA